MKVNLKSDGDGIMISAFVLRDFGFGRNLTDEQLKRVNEYRKDKEYLDGDAAMKVNNKKKKDPLNTSPFVREFDYGQNQDGYWCYDTMVIQFKDVLDCLYVLYNGQYDFIFSLIIRQDMTVYVLMD